MSGVYDSDCYVPCKSTTVKISSGNIFRLNQSFSIIFIIYNQKVQTRTIVVDKFDFFGALNYLGSNMGLLPGMGLFQIFEFTIIVLLSYREIFRNNRIFQVLFT